MQQINLHLVIMFKVKVLLDMARCSCRMVFPRRTENDVMKCERQE